MVKTCGAASQRDVKRKKGEKRLRKIVLAIFVIALVFSTMIISLAALKLTISQDDVCDFYETLEICGKRILTWAEFPCHTLRFWEVPAFIVIRNDTLLDLNGHTVIFKTSVAGEGKTGVEVENKGSVTIRNGTLMDFQYGISVYHSSEVKIEYVNITGSKNDGISATDSERVDIGFNNVSKSGDEGIGIDNCFDVSIHDNTVLDNTGEGIYVKKSDHNIVSRNLVSGNGYYGIYIYNSNNNNISDNTVSDNLPNGGIYMSGADYNNISDNTVSNNPKGMEMKSSFNNTIYHNNFIENPINVGCDEASSNVWDAGYGLVDDIGYGGNYWDEYDSTDEFSGKNQDIPGSDGISDTLYTINENNQDSYPLMNPWDTMLVDYDITWRIFDPRVGWENRTCQAAVFSNSSVTDFDFNRAEGELNFTATNGTFCNVIVPRDALDGAFAVTIDDSLSASILTWDENHYFIYFSMMNGSHEVKIKSETVIRFIGDLNNDGIVNIIDIAIVATEFGKKIG